MGEFAMNTITRDGAALIAQATAANPIVIVAGVSCSEAAASASDLADKPASWYTGTEGVVVAVSASAAVARIVVAFRPEGSEQPARSIAVLARLASQSVAQSVILCAMSDPDSTVVLPGSDSMFEAVEVPFNVAIDPINTVQVTPGGSASLSDLDRFVSCHAPGNSTGPENQIVYGWKVFRTRISAADARIADGQVSGNLDFGDPESVQNRTAIRRNDAGELELQNGGYSVGLTESGAVALGAGTSIQYDDNTAHFAGGLPVSVSSVGPALTIARANDTSLTFNPSNNLSAARMSGTTVTVPIGAIVYGIFGDITTDWDIETVSVGETLSIPASGVRLAEYYITGSTDGWRAATVTVDGALQTLYLPEGTYRTLCQIDLAESTAFKNTPVLLMRVS